MTFKTKLDKSRECAWCLERMEAGTWGVARDGLISCPDCAIYVGEDLAGDGYGAKANNEVSTEAAAAETGEDG